jgi:7-carboxy-7-deazaguanine synthase
MSRRRVTENVKNKKIENKKSHIESASFFLNECFESIQGEGNYAGVNSLFLRFHFCNLTCSWCDSKFTWFGNARNYVEHTSSQIKDIIIAHTPKHVILTGGEPSLYPLDQLVVPGKKFHVESNGTCIPTEPLEITVRENVILRREGMDESVISHFNWVVSPKLSNSRQEVNEKSLSFWSGKTYCIFKFVVRDGTDIDEVENVIGQYSIDRSKVYLAIEGQTLESQLQPEMVDEIVKRGFHFSPRLHVMLWGTQRGK